MIGVIGDMSEYFTVGEEESPVDPGLALRYRQHLLLTEDLQNRLLKQSARHIPSSSPPHAVGNNVDAAFPIRETGIFIAGTLQSGIGPAAGENAGVFSH